MNAEYQRLEAEASEVERQMRILSTTVVAGIGDTACLHVHMAGSVGTMHFEAELLQNEFPQFDGSCTLERSCVVRGKVESRTANPLNSKHAMSPAVLHAANSNIGYRNISDGSTKVIMVGERYSPIISTSSQFVIGDGAWVGAPGVGLDDSFYSSSAIGEALMPINALYTSTVPRPQTTGFGSMHTGDVTF